MEIEYRCLGCHSLFDGHPLGLTHLCPICKSKNVVRFGTYENLEEDSNTTVEEESDAV